MYTTGKTLSHIIDFVAASTGEEFFHKMSEALAEAVGADLCLIATFEHSHKTSTSNTISVYAHGSHSGNFRYDLNGTPCQEVACNGVSIYPAGVARLFPKDLMLSEMKIEAYVGTGLQDLKGEVIGLVVAMFNKEIDHPDPIHTLYQLFSSRIALEIDRMALVRGLQESNETLEQRVLQRTKDLETANGDIKRFAYIVSHDLRAPLVNIKGFSSELTASMQDLQHLLKDQILKGNTALQLILEEDIPEAITFIQTSVTKMDRQINAILTLSRIGSRIMRPETINMRQLVKEQLALLHYHLNRNAVEVVVQDLPEITADRLSMEQIFANLLGNAIKFLDPSRPGQLHISAEATETDPKGSVFHIRDNGRGIAQDEIAIIFEIFKRAGSQDTIGEGMGLAYVKSLVLLHQGDIWCHSELGNGSTFSFSINP